MSNNPYTVRVFGMHEHKTVTVELGPKGDKGEPGEPGADTIARAAAAVAQATANAAVPKVTTVNGHTLTSDISLNATDVGADPVGAAAAITLAGLGGVPTSRKVSGHALTSDISITASDVGADPAGAAEAALSTAEGYTNIAIAGVTLAGLGGVPITRTVNGHGLGTDISLSAADVGADPSGAAAAITLAGLGGVPTSRTVNGHGLGTDVSLTAADVGADVSGAAATALSSAESYADSAVGALAPDIKHSKWSLCTGIITKGTISINSADHTLLDISAGSSLYVDNSNPNSPVVEVLTWSNTTILPAIAGQGLDTLMLVWVGIARQSPGVGVPVLATQFSETDRRVISVLGRLWSDGVTATISACGNYQSPAWGWSKTFEDFCDAIGGALNIDGNVWAPYPGTLKMQKNAGHSFRLDSNSGVTMDSPSWRTDAALVPQTAYRYWAASGDVYRNQLWSTLDPNYWDNAGTRTAVPSGKWTVQRIYYFPGSGSTVLTYGQAVYDTLIETKTAVVSEVVTFTSTATRMFYGAVLRGWVIVKQGCTDTDPAGGTCYIEQASQFLAGGVSGGGASITDHSLLSNLDYSSAGHTGFVPSSRSVNGHTLTGDISLSAADVGADVSGAAASAITTAEGYADSVVGTHNALALLAHGGIAANYIMATGLVSGGTLAVNGSDNTKFDIAAGTAVIVNTYTTPTNPTATPISWSAKTAIVDSYLSTTDITYIGIDASGNVIQSVSLFTTDQMRDIVFLGANGHPTRTSISYASSTPSIAYEPGKTIEDFLNAFGEFCADGNVYYPLAALYLGKSAGATFAIGQNYSTNRKSPHITLNPAQSSPGQCVILYARRDGSGGWVNLAPGITVDPNHYDDGSGTLASVPSSKWTIQCVFYFSEPALNFTGIQYGQVVYDTLALAKAAIQDGIAIDPSTSAALFRCWLIVQQGQTSLTSSNFIAAGKFGMSSVMSTGVGGETNTASNIGTTGIGFYAQKLGVDLEFKNLKSSTGKITIADSPSDHTVDIGVSLAASDVGAVPATTSIVAAVNLAAGQPVYVDGTSGQLGLSIATTYAKCFVMGLAAQTTSATYACPVATNSLTLADWTAITGSSALVKNQLYWLSVTEGLLSTSAPITPGQSLVVVGKAISATTLEINPTLPILL